MFSDQLKKLRITKDLKLRELSASTGIDQTLLSRFERGDRLPTEKQIQQLADALKEKSHNLETEWLAEKIVKVVKHNPTALEALRLAETRVEYLLSKNTIERPVISDSIRKKLIRIDNLKAEWKSKHPLNISQLKRMQEYFDTEYTYESNRIEGNTLTLQETMLVISEGLTIGGKSMTEHLEAINHAHAIHFMREMIKGGEDLSKRNVLDLHRLILKGIDDQNAGTYRNVPVRISGSSVRLPPPYLVSKLMEDYYRYYETFKTRIHPVLLAADMHERLVSIHPFIDGNGRTSRLIMNLILLKHGYTTVNIKGSPESRSAYFRALAEMQSNNNSDPFYDLITDECINSLQRHLELT